MLIINSCQHLLICTECERGVKDSVRIIKLSNECELNNRCSVPEVGSGRKVCSGSVLCNVHALCDAHIYVNGWGLLSAQLYTGQKYVPC